MSSLRSALEEWITEDADALHVDQLADDLVELELVSGLIEAIRADRIEVFGRKAGHRAHGYPSMTAFLKHRCRMATGRARRLVAAAQAKDIAPQVFQAWFSSRLSTDQAHRLLDTASAAPKEFSSAEEILIEAVQDLSHADTRRVLDYWRQSVDGPDTAMSEVEQEDLRGVSMSISLGGMLRVDAWMTPVAGQALLTALDALMPPPDPHDGRTPRQRRHDALEDLAREYLDQGQTPTVGGEKPHITLVCDLPALQGIAGGLHETETGQVLTVDQLRTVVCDCSISRVVLGPDSEIIDVGRRTRLIPAGLRRAIIARDRHCTWAGCDRNPRWCDGSFPQSDGHLRPGIASWGKGAHAHVGPLSARIPGPGRCSLPRRGLCE
ncbi:MAG TPA: DUF222 domain-containing protein, partial [Acidimicrobiia bacterium]|nr:DUF222 domain-containing protein [Acidimicrobiia bacterium]